MRSVVSCLTVLLLSGCAQVFYYARKPDADGQGHEAIASWSVTERAFWFDESSETVRVTLQCGRTIPFQERAGGLYALFDPSLMSEPRSIDGAKYCGQVIGARRLDDLATGESLQVELWCKPAEADELVIQLPALPPGEYKFAKIWRGQRDPQTAPCDAEPPEQARR